jgi:phospholipid-binding lipoprotein MlaA
MRSRRLLTPLLILTSLLFSGCAATNGPAVEHDPWEGMNRATYAFNTAADEMVIAPVARGYRYVTPRFLRRGVSNFFSNLDDIFVVVNDVLQLKLMQGLSDTTRFVLNTTIGIGGLFDVATPLGLEKHNEDFGQTLGHWGMPPGPYLVLPILGPSSVRDTGGLVVDAQYDPIRGLDETEMYTTKAVGAISKREQLLEASSLLQTAALDPYSYTREAWLARRARLVNDGQPQSAPAASDSDALDELDTLDSMDELDQLDALDDAPARKPGQLDELDELDRLDVLDQSRAPSGADRVE